MMRIKLILHIKTKFTSKIDFVFEIELRRVNLIFE